MTEDENSWKKDWIVGIRVSVERAGQTILGKGRLELLEAIERWHSISEAARQRGISYRHAWMLVQSMNEAAGEPLVLAAPGGQHGGGAQLTPLGRRALAVVAALQDQLHRTAATLLPGLVPGRANPDLHVAAAVSLEEVLGQLLADYSLRRPIVPVRVIYGASDELAAQVLAGAPTDLFLAADSSQLDRLEAAQRLLPGSRRLLAENRLVAIAQSDRPLPVRAAADLLRSEVQRVALALPSCPLGNHTRTFLEASGLYATLQTRALLMDNSRGVVTAVRSGQADVGLVYLSDAMSANSCRILFRVRHLPAPMQYVAGLVVPGSQSEQAHDLLAFLTSLEAAQRFRRCGFLPCGKPAH